MISTSGSSCENGSCNTGVCNILHSVLFVGTFLLAGFVAYASRTGMSVEKSLTMIEATKVGGPENYAIVQKIYGSDKFKKQQAESLTTALSQFDGSAAQAPKNDPATPPTAAAPTADSQFPKGTLTSEQVTTILADMPVDGNSKSPFVLIEYSDLQCPYCKKFHHDDATPKKLLDKYGDKLSFIFKHFPLSFHQNAPKAAQGVECAADQDANKYYSFISAVFAKGDPTTDVLKASAKEIGLDEAKFATCVESNADSAKIAAQQAEGAKLFNIQGTPGNVLLNKATGERVLIAGAYPSSEFEKTLDVWTK